MCSGCLGREVWGTLGGQRRWKGLAAHRPPAQFARSSLGSPSRRGQRGPVAAPHCAPSLGSGVGNGVVALPCRRLGPSSSDQVYSACYCHCHSVGGRLRRGEHASLWSVTATSLDAPGGADAHPPPALLRDSPRGRTDHSTPEASLPANRQLRSPALGVTSGRTGQGEAAPERLGGLSCRAPDPAGASGWAGPGGPGVQLQRLREPARTRGRRARASRPRAPGSIFSPH